MRQARKAFVAIVGCRTDTTGRATTTVERLFDDSGARHEPWNATAAFTRTDYRPHGFPPFRATAGIDHRECERLNRMTDLEPTTVLAWVDEGTERLLDTAGSLSADEIAAPSPLPGWTRGHVLTHLARNADSLVNLLTWARTCVVTPQYPSPEQRDADIAAGAGRPLDEQLADLRKASEHFDAAAREMTAAQWQVVVGGVPAGRPAHPAARIPWRRLIEVEVHHVDLDAGYTPAHWPAEFTGPMLDEIVAYFTAKPETPALTARADDTDRSFVIGSGGPTITGPEPALLAWLIGRSNGDGLIVDPHGPLPTIPAWR
jgi:maleylpyruvate isomerase